MLPILADVIAKIHEATEAGSGFRNTIIDFAKAGVIGLYQFGDAVKESMADFTDFRVHALELQKLWFNITHPGMETGLRGGKLKYQDQAAVDEFWALDKAITDAHKRAADLRKASATPDRISEIEDYFAGLKTTMTKNAHLKKHKSGGKENDRYLNWVPCRKAKHNRRSE